MISVSRLSMRNTTNGERGRSQVKTEDNKFHKGNGTGRHIAEFYLPGKAV